MSKNASDRTREHDATCVTKHLAADLYCCMLRKADCRHAVPCGYEYLCEHPDRAALCVDILIRDNDQKGRP